MLKKFSIRIKNIKSGNLYIMSVMACDYEQALTLASKFTANMPDVSVCL